MTVYRIFSDDPRSDNIDTIYLNRKEAEFAKEGFNQWCKSNGWTTYHVEELEVIGKLDMEVIENEQSTESEAF